MHLLIEQLQYNQWAMRRYVQSLKELEPSCLTQPLTSSFSSIRETLWHMLWVEELWYERWQGHHIQRRFDPKNAPPFEAMENRFTEIHAKQIQFLQTFPKDAGEEKLSYLNFKNERCEYTITHFIQHLVFHSAYHRGQLATMLRQIGKVPPATDFLIYIDEIEQEKNF